MRRAVLMSAALLGLAISASADTYIINPSGTGDFPTIQLAIHAAMDGDIIELTDGVFRGDGNRDIDFLGKAITIRSRNGNPSSCIIDCEGTPTTPHRGFYFHFGEGSGSIVDGLTIQNGNVGQDGCGGAVTCQEGTWPSLVNCTFRANSARQGGAIECLSASPGIADCAFLENVADCGGAIICCFESWLSLTNCSFAGNTADEGGAVYT